MNKAEMQVRRENLKTVLARGYDEADRGCVPLTHERRFELQNELSAINKAIKAENIKEGVANFARARGIETLVADVAENVGTPLERILVTAKLLDKMITDVPEDERSTTMIAFTPLLKGFIAKHEQPANDPEEESWAEAWEARVPQTLSRYQQCGMRTVGHHTGTCTLRAGHKGICKEES